MPFMFRSVGGALSGAWAMILTQGICLVLFGVLILLVPELLIYLVGSFFLLGGLFLIGLSLQIRRQAKGASRVFREFRAETFTDDRSRLFGDDPF